MRHVAKPIAIVLSVLLLSTVVMVSYHDATEVADDSCAICKAVHDLHFTESPSCQLSLADRPFWATLFFADNFHSFQPLFCLDLSSRAPPA